MKAGTTVSNTKQEHVAQILEEFFKHLEYVELGYLFGSTARAEDGILSDIDIAVYLKDGLSNQDQNQKRLELISGLTTLLKSDRVDLVIMNRAPPVLNFEVIKVNMPVYVRDRDFKLEVEQKIMSRYLDRKHHEDFLNRSFLERIVEKGLS
ncbi:MAG: nucleotidyltransferase domain-containing protein [ANME-2 cluster archaeon]|nr:nucleotidyltransferase domain-containing protein [ANME-2 cluster archaeon]